jgi:hypothetical protein
VRFKRRIRGIGATGIVGTAASLAQNPNPAVSALGIGLLGLSVIADLWIHRSDQDHSKDKSDPAPRSEEEAQPESKANPAEPPGGGKDSRKVNRKREQSSKIVTGDYLCEKLFGLAARAAQVNRRECVGEDIRERVVLFTIVDEIQMRGWKRPWVLDVSRENRDKLSGTVDRQWRKQKRAHDAEDCGIGSYTQSQ